MSIEYIPPDEKAVVKVDQTSIPDEIPILPLNDQVAYPTLNMSLAVPMRDSSVVESAMKGDRLIGIVGIKTIVGAKNQMDGVPLPGQVYETGTVVRVLYVTRAPDNTVLLIVHGIKRFRIMEWLPGKDFLRAKIRLIPEIMENDIETAALHRSLRDLTQEIFSLSPNIPNEAIEGLTQIKNSLHLAYIAAAHSEIDFEKRQALLEEDSLKAKLRELVKLLSREKEILSLGKKIKSNVRDEMSKSQRDYYLRQQLKAIKKELGELGENQSEPDNYQQRIVESDMTDEAREQAIRELERLDEMTPLANLEDAARKIALFEEKVIYHGLPEANIRGLALCAEGECLTMGSKPEQLLEAIAEGITVFTGRSVEGPYAFVVGPKLWSLMSAHLQGYPVKMQAENILGGQVVLSPYLTGKYESEAFMLSQRGGDLEIILGQDMAVGYDSHSSDKVKLYYTESFTFRILEPAAVIHYNAVK